MLSDDALQNAMKAVDDAVSDIQAVALNPAPVSTPIEVHIAELFAAMHEHNKAIAEAQKAYAESVDASRQKLETAQNDLRIAERELAMRWHGGPIS